MERDLCSVSVEGMLYAGGTGRTLRKASSIQVPLQIQDNYIPWLHEFKAFGAIKFKTAITKPKPSSSSDKIDSTLNFNKQKRCDFWEYIIFTLISMALLYTISGFSKKLWDTPQKNQQKIHCQEINQSIKSYSEMFHIVALSESNFTKTVINMLTDEVFEDN